MNLIPAAVLPLSVSPNYMSSSIPVYRPDGSLYASVSEERLTRLETAGLVARVVRHRKGHINRAILFALPGDPSPTLMSVYLGTRYSYLEKLDSGPQCWQLKRLNLKDEDGAVIDGRSVFLRVVQDCTVA